MLNNTIDTPTCSALVCFKRKYFWGQVRTTKDVAVEHVQCLDARRGFFKYHFR